MPAITSADWLSWLHVYHCSGDEGIAAMELASRRKGQSPGNGDIIASEPAT